MSISIILASGSPFRAALITNAGLSFETVVSTIDERSVEATLSGTGATPADIASVLAEAKAGDVAARHRGAYVIGADQTLSFNNEVLHKPSDMEEARRRLLELSGQTHQLNSAIVLMHGEDVLWRDVEVASLTMRHLEPAFVGRHLSRVGEKALTSVGAYQIEGEGIQLFEKIDGDIFTIMGLPLLPLLKELRMRKLIDG